MIKVTHDRFSDSFAKRVVFAVCPDGIRPYQFDVMIKNSRHALRGRAYPKGSCYHGSAKPFIVAALGHASRFPHNTIDGKTVGKGYLRVRLYTIEEGLVFVLAHEVRHLWQGKYKGSGRVYGSKGVFSERDADAYALSCVRKFRRGELLAELEKGV